MTDRLRKIPKELWMALSLAVMTAAAYFYVVHCGFVNYDDPAYVTANTIVQKGLSWSGLRYAFTHPVLNLYTPITLLSHMLDCQLFGMNPGGAHAMSLLYHLVSTLLLFWMLDKMTKEPWPSWAVAALFGVHPMHVEAVAWIAERKEVLSTLFGLLALLAYAYYVESRSRRAYWTVFAGLLLSLLAKPMLVTLPFLLLLLDLWPLGRLAPFEPWPPREEGKAPPWPYRLKADWLRQLWPLVREKIPLFLLAFVFSVATYVMNWMGGTLPTAQELSWGFRIKTVFYAYGQYIAKLFLPVGLSVFYPMPHLKLTIWTILPSVALVLMATLLGLRLAQKVPSLLVGWLWFLGTLVPVIGLIHVGSLQAYADRYSYFTYTGLFVTVVWPIYEVLKGKKVQSRIALELLGGLLALLAIQSALQVTAWRDTESLFTHSLEVAPQGNYVAMGGLGMVYYDKYKNIEGAKFLLKRAISIGPIFANWYNLGVILLQQGEYAAAEACLRKALATSRPEEEGGALAALAFVCTKQGNYGEALRLARKAQVLSPGEERAREDEVDALLGLGRCGEAAEAAIKGLSRHPGSSGLAIRVAVALLGQGKVEAGKPYIERALLERRGNPAVFFEAASEMLLIPSADGAVRQAELTLAQRAVSATRGGQPWYLLVFGQALAANGKRPEAQQVLADCLAKAKAKKMQGLERIAQRAMEGLSSTGAMVPAGGAEEGTERETPSARSKTRLRD
ncbi:MAG: tetratricopeptide repeat protein [Acidobacteriota bacterium]